MLLGGTSAVVRAQAPARPPIQVTDDEIDAAVARGAKYLLGMQSPDGSWRTHKLGVHANTVLCMMGLAYTDVDPKSEQIKKGLTALMACDLMKDGPSSYLTAFRLQALGKWFKNRQLDREMRDLVWEAIKKDAEQILKGQCADGGWGYSLDAGPTFADFSNVQICMLGLGEAIKAGVELPKPPLEKAMLLYVTKQLPDGGWNYGRTVNDQWPWTTDQAMPSYGSMTAAGVASLYIARDYCYAGMGCPCAGGRSSYRLNKVDEAIDKALDWLGQRYTPTENPKSTHFTDYWLYSCERVGLASGIKYFGAHNWYAEGARIFLAGQGADGGWGHAIYEGTWNGGSGGTAFAILFLVKGRAPIIMNKVRFAGAWNMHPHDLKNLARFVGDHKEQDFAWQVITLEAPVDEWHDSPILYLTPEAIIKFTDDEMQKLRKYTDDGGTIFFEASCGNPTIRSWWKATAEKIWPEFEFRNVDKEHPIWKADLAMVRPLSGLQEMADGMRTFMFFAPNDISCAWNTSAVTKRGGEFQFGINLYSYATDRAKIRSRLSKATIAKASEASLKSLQVSAPRPLTVALMKHGGDWNVSERYRLVEKLAARLADSPLAITAAPSAAPSDAALPAGAVLYATGRAGLSLLDTEKEALKKRLAGGAFLIVDAATGDARFQKAFDGLAGEMGWTVRRLDDKHAILTGAMTGGTGHRLEDGLRFSYHAVANSSVPLRLDLRGIYVGEKLVGVYSPRDIMYSQADLKAFGTVGYDTISAQHVVENLLVYAVTVGQPAPAAAPAAPPVAN